MRKSPIKHHVKSYKRDGKRVQGYTRGEGARNYSKLAKPTVINSRKTQIYQSLQNLLKREHGAFIVHPDDKTLSFGKTTSSIGKPFRVKVSEVVKVLNSMVKSGKMKKAMAGWKSNPYTVYWTPELLDKAKQHKGGIFEKIVHQGSDTSYTVYDVTTGKIINKYVDGKRVI